MRSPVVAPFRALTNNAPAPLDLADLKDASLPVRGVRIGRSMLAPVLPPMVVATLAPGLMQVSAE